MASDFPPLADIQSLLWQHVTTKKERDLLDEYAGRCLEMLRLLVSGVPLSRTRVYPHMFCSLLRMESSSSYTDLYAIIKTTEKLERSYVRDAIPAKDYEVACQRLIGHYKTLWETVKESVPSIQSFMASYHLQCPMGARRLSQSGMPATVEHGKPGAGATDGGYTAAVADAVGQYITTMDALKLNMAAVDQIFPLLSDLTQTLNKVTRSVGLYEVQLARKIHA